MGFSLLIADDEMLARHSLHTMVSRNFDNISVIGEAENGRQAVEMALQLKPDIVFMDIKMPGINGIDASGRILEKYPDIIIIILTAYDNFSYAQKAINLGIEGYLLKPIKEKEVVDKLSEITDQLELRIKQNIPSEKSSWFLSEDGDRTLHGIPQDIQLFLEEEFIALIIGDNKDNEMFRQIQEILRIKIDSGFFLLINCPSCGEDEKRRFVQIMRQKIRSISSRRTGSDLAFFIPRESIESETDNIKKFVNDYFRQISALYEVEILCGSGSIGGNIKGLERSFYQALTSLKGANIETPCVSYDPGRVEQPYLSADYPFEQESLLLEKIHGRSFDEVQELLDAIYKKIFEIKDFRFMKEFAAEFILILIRTARILSDEELKGVSPFVIQDLINQSSSQDLKYLLKSTGNQILKNLKEVSGDTNWWLQRAFVYLRKNLYTDISLDIIADEVGMSPQHLSRIFKGKYGKTIGEYITDHRMNYAKYLLSGSDNSIKDISHKTGYSDQNYFTRVFKKYTGYTPSRYKELFQ